GNSLRQCYTKTSPAPPPAPGGQETVGPSPNRLKQVRKSRENARASSRVPTIAADWVRNRPSNDSTVFQNFISRLSDFATSAGTDPSAPQLGVGPKTCIISRKIDPSVEWHFHP